MAQMQLYHTTSDKLSDLSIEDGRIIFCSDTRTVYLDINSRRESYTTIYVFDLERDRILSSPSVGFYYVAETNVLWRYNGAWLQITPAGLNPIVMGETVENFPSIGDENKLYAGDDAIYKWKSSDMSYRVIANKNEWETL